MKGEKRNYELNSRNKKKMTKSIIGVIPYVKLHTTYPAKE